MHKLVNVPHRPGIAGHALSPEQRRFNTLIGQIEQARELLASWHENIGHYRETYRKVQLPLLEDYRGALRQWVFALDAVIESKGWTRLERETMSELVCECAEGLLRHGADPELKALISRRAEVDIDDLQADRLRTLKAMVENVTGLDLGDDDGVADESELLRRMRDGMKAREETHQDTPKPKRKSAAQKRRDTESEEATLSVREIFRKLASALHPDRETDPDQRSAKTVLMQEVNKAYADKDLLTLLELQLRIEQVDAQHLAAADAKRLKHYNKVLADQLKQLRQETDHVATTFAMEFGLNAEWRPHPKRLGASLAEQTRQLRAAVAATTGEIRMFADSAATKRWLKIERIRLRDDDVPMGDFFR